MKLEVGGMYELNNGFVVECVEGPDIEGDFKMGNGCWYSSNGALCGSSEHHYNSIKRRVDAPKKWGNMTDAEKGALLLAHHEGKVIQYWDDGFFDIPFGQVGFYDSGAYRVRPEPVREVVTGWWNGKNFHNTANYSDRTHRITFETVDGKPNCDTIKMEPLP